MYIYIKDNSDNNLNIVSLHKIFHREKKSSTFLSVLYEYIKIFKLVCELDVFVTVKIKTWFCCCSI